MTGTRYTYEFRTDKNGKEYCHITSSKTGKFVKNVRSKKNLQTAHKSANQQVYRAENEVIRKEIEWTGYGGTVADYKRERKRHIKEITDDRDKRKLKKSDKSIIRQAEHAAYKSVGHNIIYRFYWKYWGDICEYTFVATEYHESQYEDGTPTEIYNNACELVKNVYKNIIDEYYLYNTPRKGNKDEGSNGGQVRLISRSSGEIIKEYNIPKASIRSHTVICVNGEPKKLKVGDKVNI